MNSESFARTPLYETLKEQGGKFVPFAGWEMPVQFSGVVDEHHAVRTAAGLFDVSHMGEIFIEGPEAEKFLDYLSCNNVTKLYDGKAHYSALINEKGGVVDDVIIYRFNPERYLLCVNAANCAKDFNWINKQNRFDAKVIDRSSDYAQIAVQGPQAIELVSRFIKNEGLKDLKYFHFREFQVLGSLALIARTGYTGEDGFEVFMPPEIAPSFWNGVLKLGEKEGVKPCGLGSRDSLRLEACYPLHGHELGDDISAIESNLSWIVKLKKGDFIGRDVLLRHKEEGAPRSLVGFFVEDKGIARHGDEVFSTDGKVIGIVTSGTKTPTVNRALGLALVQSEYKEIGTKLKVKVRGRELGCKVVETPFYTRRK